MNQPINSIGFHLKELTKLAVLSGIDTRELQRFVRREHLLEAMTICGGNQCHAAKLMGVHRNTLSRMLDLAGLASSTGKSKRPQSAAERRSTAA